MNTLILDITLGISAIFSTNTYIDAIAALKESEWIDPI